ncbi:MAG: hypothetical protein V4565_02630 [Bacteroidota bacterium]
MRNTLLILSYFLIFISAHEIFGQSKTTVKNSYNIHPNRSLNNTESDFFAKSIEEVDFEKYRLKSKDVVLVFTNGFNLVLTAADRLSLNGILVNTADYSEDATSEYIYPSFKIDESGIVVTMYRTKPVKSELKNITK